MVGSVALLFVLLCAKKALALTILGSREEILSNPVEETPVRLQ